MSRMIHLIGPSRSSRRPRLAMALGLAAALVAAAASARGQGAGPSEATPAAVPVEAASGVDSVTVYRGRAAVKRRFVLDRDAGLYDLKFSALPRTLQPETLQARVVGPARVLGVRYDQRESGEAPSPRLAEIDEEIRAIEAALAAVADEREVVAGQLEFLDAVSVRAASDATDRAGTETLDLDAVRTQLAFITEERTRLVTRRRTLAVREQSRQETLRRLRVEREAIAGGGRVERVAVATVALLEAGAVTVDLVYLVSEATWSPAYNIRAAADGSSVEIEYDAMLAQRTGEDWTDVGMTLSTAQPTVAANPPTLDPWYVDLVVSTPGFGEGRSLPPGSRSASVDADMIAGKRLEEMSRDAAVGGAGPSVTYALPRTVTVRSDARQQQRTRIAGVETTPRFMHVAVPVLTDAVYIRGAVANASPYQLLPGPASIFVGADYVGPTTLDAVAPGGRFELYFGIDPAVTATRQLVTRETEKTGLLGGGRKTSDAYRITVSNGAGKSIALELWDRRPVSRTDQVAIEVVDLSHALATDAIYVEEDAPRGLLKWFITVPPDPVSGDPAMTVTFGVNVARAKDVEITPLPE